MPKTNLDPDSFHSIIIALCRGLAAIVVAAAHVRAQTFPGLRTLDDPGIWYLGIAFFTGFAHQGVVVFFLVSGWLVGGSLLNKLHVPDAIANYSIDRITRLWIVLIPAFIATLIFAASSDWIDVTTLDRSTSNEYSISAFFGNLVGLQDIIVPRFGGNFALWSLAYEFWYYVLFPLILLAFIAKDLLAKIIAAVLAAIIVFNLSTVIMLYFSIWLLGTAFSRIQISLDQRSKFILLLVFIATAVYFRLTGMNDSFTEETFPQDLMYSLLFLTLLASQQSQVNAGSRVINWLKVTGTFLSSFSFTLYVIHVPLLRWILDMNKSLFGIDGLSPELPSHYAIYFAIVTALLLFSYLFYLAFEAHTYKVRAFLKASIQNFLFKGAHRPVSSADASKN